MAERNVATIASDLYALLEPCTHEERQRAVRAAFALLGEEPSATAAEVPARAGGRSTDNPLVEGLGPKAAKWIQQHGLTRAQLDSAFYFHDGKVEVHVDTVAGKSKREQTINCYLLAGARAYLEADIASFNDSDAIKLCKHTQSYDKNNHTANRNALGNRVTGNRENGFELTGPGLKAAAALLVELGSNPTA
jgi:hypothetical protein